jgi:uncharacterized protein (TIGR03083 family)
LYARGVTEIADDVVAEHIRIADLLEEVGPEAPAGVDDWTTADLAAHLVWQLAAGGFLVLPGRVLLVRGFHLPIRATSSSSNRLDALYRRKGFGTAIQSLRKGPPRLLLRDMVAPVALFEVWVHHDDIRRANQLAPDAEPETLGHAVDFALRCQRKALGSTMVDRGVSNGELIRWLAGRPSKLPAHSPPLRFGRTARGHCRQLFARTGGSCRS